MPQTQQSDILTVPETPFAETGPFGESIPESVGLLPWTESPSPFSERDLAGFEREDEQTELFLDTFEELRDESFDEALAELVAETSEAAGVGVQGEQADAWGAQRQLLAQAHLGPIGAEAERCVQRFMDHVAHVDPETISQSELEDLLERFDPGPASVSPAGEQFLGSLIKKAKSIAGKVVDVAKKVVSKIPFLGAILKKLKGLIDPLLKRVLGMAIGRLPAALQQPARDLAKKIGIGEHEDESFDELEDEAEEETLGEDFAGSPVKVLDPETLGESLDAVLAASMVSPEALEQSESFGPDTGSEVPAGTELEQLAAARGRFMNRVRDAGDGEDLGPAMEQFIPAILPALKLGLRLIGRTKVVNFLAKYLAQLIGKWVGPQLSVPLSRAVVDVGLRVIGLEHDGRGELESEAVPAMLATTVEETVRRLAEQPEHVLEDEALLQVAVAEAFEQSVAANFPATLVRPDLRLAPSLGGTFVTRHARTPHAYKKFTRTPEIELTQGQAAAVRSFGGVTLDAALRAHGITLPGRFRVLVFEAATGTTLPTLARLEGIVGPSGTHGAYSHLHPLTRANATTLLREPRLGVDAPARFLQSRHRISVGQRFFHLQPVGQQPTPLPMPTREAPSCDPGTPSDRRMRLDVRRGEARIALYFSEPDAQRIAASLGSDPASPALLKALLEALRAAGRSVGRSDGAVQIPAGAGPGPSTPAPTSPPPPSGASDGGDGQSEWESRWEAQWEAEWERRANSRRRRHPRRHHRLSPGQRARLRRRIRAAASTALSAWARSSGQEFVRAAQDAKCGVTVRIRVTGLATSDHRSTATVTVGPGRSRP
ncbi:hypothetical protein G7075_17635 [Phycicoccus sp. HDW14]|uniref:hypothetical protein n=1 Tax=Phycicoccus sp. HDW14 TaxID=2714941 RepID=UPI00140A9180|nr:hypothetical protein [Phycicoccus sp. HDW14]QIM22527.1 hypothetical protein G7075_17635 [Phycicoccus sp. HDW14]